MKRLDYIDTAKGILIILVVVVHYLLLIPSTAYGFTYVNAVRRIIYFFHMPAFFIIAGILANPLKWNSIGFIDFLKKRFIRLMIPFFSFEFIAGVLRIVLFGTTPFTVIMNTLNLTCNLGSNWFIYSLFVAEILFYYVHKLGKGVNTILAGIIFLLPLLHVSSQIWLAIMRPLIALAFIIIGYYFKEFWVKKNALLAAICLILVVASAVLRQHMEIWDVSITNPPLYLFRAFGGTYAVICFSQIFPNTWLSICGINSLGIMMTHHLFRYYVMATGSVVSIPTFFIAFIEAVVFTFVSTVILNRLAPIIIGKNPTTKAIVS